MLGPEHDSLARELPTQSGHVSTLHDLPGIDDSTLLDRFLSRLRERIAEEGLTSLYWVTGIHTQEIASSLLEALSQQADNLELSGERYCIVIKPTDGSFVEPFGKQFDISIRSMSEFYIDSFVIVNEEAVLDVTPVAADDGNPEYNDDPTIVSLYIGLFNMLRNGTSPI